MHYIPAMPMDLTEGNLPLLLGRSRLKKRAGEARCECATCGAHAFAPPGAEDSARCGNCGSNELRPLASVA